MPEILEKPPAAAGEHICWLPRHRKSAGRARRLLRGFLAGLDGGELFAEVGELLLSELVTNSIQHARVPPGRLIQVRFELSGGVLRIEVHDASGDRPTVRAVGGEDESGRGLLLVEQVVGRVGLPPTRGRDRQGDVVPGRPGCRERGVSADGRRALNRRRSE